MNNTSNYFDGPSVNQGVTGTWFASGTITLFSGAGTNIQVKLWDGTTVIASCEVDFQSTAVTAALSGFLASPAGNLRISARDPVRADTLIKFNVSGNSKDSTITAFRIA